jgi:hypothetical protein
MYLTNTTNTVKNLTIGFDIQTELLDFVVVQLYINNGVSS